MGKSEDDLRRFLISTPMQEALRDMANELDRMSRVDREELAESMGVKLDDALMKKATESVIKSLSVASGEVNNTVDGFPGWTPQQADDILSKWRKAWPGVVPFYNEVLGVPYEPEDFQQRPSGRSDAYRYMGTMTGRMSGSGPQPQRLPRRAAETPMKPEAYTDSGGGVTYTPREAANFRDGHLINAVRKMKRENSGSLPLQYLWMEEELFRRGLLQVANNARGSLQKQAIGRGWTGSPGGVRRIIIELRRGAIHDRANELGRMSRVDREELAESMGVNLDQPARLVIEDILRLEFPILGSEKKLMRTFIDDQGRPFWQDADGTRTPAEEMGEAYLNQVVQLLSERWAQEDVPLGDLWVFREWVRRGLHNRRGQPTISARHLPLISEIEHEFASVKPPVRTSMEEEAVEVPLSDLVKNKPITAKKSSLFDKLRSTYTQKEKTMSESNAMSLEEQLAAHEEEVARLKAELNKQKGMLGHPTIIMGQEAFILAGKMRLSKEALELVETVARKVALKFFVPEGHEEILDTPQGRIFIDLAMPTALHLAASYEWFGEGSEYVAAVGQHALAANMYDHMGELTSKAKEVMGEVMGELNQMKELGKELLGFGQSGNLLAEVTDFGAMAEELTKEKSKAEAKG